VSVNRDDSFAVSCRRLGCNEPRNGRHACNPIDTNPWSYLMMYVDYSVVNKSCDSKQLLPTPVAGSAHGCCYPRNRWFDRYCHLADCFWILSLLVTDKQRELRGFLSGSHARAGHSANQSAGPATADVLTQLFSLYSQHCGQKCFAGGPYCAFSGFSEGHLDPLPFKTGNSVFTPHAYLVESTRQLGRVKLKKGTPIARGSLNAGLF